MLFPDPQQLLNGLAEALYFSTTNLVPHSTDIVTSTPALQRRTAASCVAPLPASCQLLNSGSSILALGTIPYVCLADAQKLSGPLYSFFTIACAINFLQTGTQYLNCLQNGLAANPVYVTCSSTSTSAAKSTSSSSSSTSKSTSSSSSSSSSSSTKASSSSSTCVGKPGYGVYDYVLPNGQSQVTNVNQCGAACLANSACKSFAFSTQSLVCFLYNVPVSTSLVSADPNSAAIFFDATCTTYNIPTSPSSSTTSSTAGSPSTCVGKPGTAPGSYVVGGPVTYSTVGACRSACAANTACKSFAYNPTIGNCYMYNSPVATVITVDTTSPYFFWDVACTTYNTPSSSTTSSTASSPSTCVGKPGTAPGSYVVGGPVTYSTVGACASACTANTACKSFAYNPTIGNCYMYNSPVATVITVDTTSPYFFFDTACTTYNMTPTSSVSVTATGVKAVAPESIVPGCVRQGAPPVPTTDVVVNGTVISTNTTSATNTTQALNVSSIATTTLSTILVIARDATSAYSAYSGLNGYGIPFQVLAVPQAGAALPTLNSSAIMGNFGAIVVLSEVSYDYGGTIGFQSALTDDQWAALHLYQLAFGVRMVRLDVFPSAESGTSAQGGCCDGNQEQLISISNSSAFPTAGLISGATMSTVGLYHYPATIINPAFATEFAQFGATTGFNAPSTAAVINNIGGRQQMVFFISFATNWSPTSNFLQHAWIHWATRGLYAGYRRVNLNTQVDDMFLQSLIYYPNQVKFRIRTGDLDAIKAWIPQINAKMASGSNYFMEIGHNGNGNIEKTYATDTTGACGTGPIEYNVPNATALEFQKDLGTGTDLWPATPTKYFYTASCTDQDALKVWWATPGNRDVFAHISHTFTHESENNATYNDIYKEISWNIAWLSGTGVGYGKYFSAKGLIPPAITGLHNGDALRAWTDNGITSCVGDNTRPVLLNTVNEHWPLLTTMANNGFDGFQITPRWATTIYYNCDSTACTVQEWIDTSAGSGDIQSLLTLERQATSRHLLGLHHDPYMFHQANLRQTDVTSTVVNGVSQQFALIQMWVETVVNEMSRLVNWPMITLKHDDISASFANRMARDACNPTMSLSLDLIKMTITGVTVMTTGNTCPQPIPVTVPGTVTNTQGFTTEQIGHDPLTIWVKMSGKPVTFVLSTPIPW